MSKARVFFRLLAVGLLLATLPADCCCAAGLADSHVDSHHASAPGADHDGPATSNSRITPDCTASWWEAEGCSTSSFLTSSTAIRVAAGIPSTGPDRAVAGVRSAGMSNFGPTITAAAPLRRPTRSPPLTLVSLQVLHLN